ncbi:hypothetical protein GQ43DRAFT_38788 [Delitschia confertaspora ATCC 74209]|uniref:Uncharacterized protein n=1 Tax=Delitschia confertaspora ATCC 74209 TaxID=1513339 RepID=A0A9P4JKX1_9PLEO|nr:hypothetical protein GQ43DRAFT_38788 [Delitschia confertaspora ATCC 74209]
MHNGVASKDTGGLFFYLASASSRIVSLSFNTLSTFPFNPASRSYRFSLAYTLSIALYFVFGICGWIKVKLNWVGDTYTGSAD